MLLMFRTSTTNKIFLILGLIMILTKNVRADDDDDDILAEIMIDLMIGVGMSICEQYATCQAIMTVVIMITLVLACIGCIISTLTGHTPSSDWTNKKTTRRFLTTGVGYSAGKAFFANR